MGVKFPLIFMANTFEALEAAIALQSDEILELSFDKEPVKSEIKHLQTEIQMWEQGLDANGQRLGSYSYTTIVAKKEKGQRFDHVTGLDTGEMYQSLMVSTDPTGINLVMFTNKDGIEDFDTKYGPVLGLTQENCNELAEFALPYVNETAREILGLR